MLQMLTRISLKQARRPAPPPETVRAALISPASLDDLEASFFSMAAGNHAGA